MAIDANEVIVIDKYNNFMLDRYNGDYSLLAVNSKDGGPWWQTWCHLDLGRENPPAEKAYPWRIMLGKTEAEAVRNLKTILSKITDDSEEIPF